MFFLKWTLAIEITDIQIDGFPMPELKSPNYPSYKSGVFEACNFCSDHRSSNVVGSIVS